MAKVTKEQLKKWTEKLQNGFGFDLYNYMMNGTKELVKKIELGDAKGSFLKANIIYREVRDGYRYTGKMQPVLSISLWEPIPDSDMARSEGMGLYHEIGSEQTKRNYNELARLSGEVTDEMIMKLAHENFRQLKNGSVMV